MKHPSQLFRTAAAKLATLKRDKKGIAAVEFALILPLMMITYLGVAEVSLVLIADRRIISVARASSDLTAQLSTIADADINAVFDTAGPLMSPFAANTVKIAISSVLFNTNPGGSGLDPVPMVDWSVTKNGAAKRLCPALTVVNNNTAASPTVVPRGVTANGQAVIIADVSYAYTPMFGARVVPGGAITLKQTTYMRPRYITRIPFTGLTASQCNVNFTG